MFEKIKDCEFVFFTKEEHELISCGFKNQLKDVREALTNLDILMSKEKFNSKQSILDQYKIGLRFDLNEKGKK